MSKTTKIILYVILVVILVGGIWYTTTRNSAMQGAIKIGLVLPLSGDLAIYGEGVKNAALLAVDNSGIKDRIQLIIEDDASCDKTGDVSIAQKFVNIDKVNGIIGPMCSSATLAILPITDPLKNVVVSPSATSKTIVQSGYNFFFRTMASDAAKSIAIANFAYEKGYRKLALINDAANDSFIQEKEDAKEAFVNLGGVVVAEESYHTNDVDFRTQLTKIKNSNSDVIIIGGFPKEAAFIVRQAKEIGINIQIMGAGPETGTPELITIAGSAAEGFIFPDAETPTNKEHSDFLASYNAKFGEDAPGYGSAEGYDATALLIKAIAGSNGSGDDIKAHLYNLGQNYSGASGLITFQKNGDVQKPMSIKIVENGQFVPYKK